MTRKPGQYWDHNWDIVKGCNWPPGKQPAGCDHCWMRGMARRFPAVHGDFNVVRTLPDKLDLPLKTRKPVTFAVCLGGDLFHEDVPYEFIDDVMDIIDGEPVKDNGCFPTTHHRFILLTKRWERAVEMMYACGYAEVPGFQSVWAQNAILLLSVWDQASCNEACAAAAKLPAGVRWGLNIEPMLGAVDWDRCPSVLRETDSGTRIREWKQPSWVIVGGETGPGARPMHPDWVRSVQRTCFETDTPFWFKSWGEWSWTYSGEPRNARAVLVNDNPIPKDEVFDADREYHREGKWRKMWRVGSKRAGRTLDGRTWEEMPW